MKKINFILALLVTVFASVFAAEVSAAGVSLSALPASNTVQVGQTATYTIKINRDNYTDKVTLSAIGLPSGTMATFTPNATTAKSSTLKLQTLTTTPVGTFNITVKGTANGITIAPIVIQLTTTPLQAISVSVLPEAQCVVAGQSTYYDLTINRTGFSGAVTLSAENVPSGVSVVFEPQVTTGNTARAWIYSDGYGGLSGNYQMNLVARRNDFPYLRAERLIRLNVNCDIVWADQGYAANGLNPDFATAVTSDSSGNIYLAGHSFNVSNNQTNIWLAKYSPTGTLAWIEILTVNGVAGLEKKVRAIGIDSANNIYVAGATQTVGQTVNWDIFVVKYNRQENAQPPQTPTQISTVFGFGRQNDYAEDGTGGMEISFDLSGRAVLTTATNIRKQIRSGSIVGFYDLSQITFSSNLVSSSSPIVRDALGVPNDVTVASNGSIYAVGFDLNEGTLDYFGWVRRYNSGGSQTYANVYLDNHFATRVAADSSGNFFVAGTFSGDVWMQKLNSQGTQQWMISESTGSEENIGDLVADSGGNVIYTGTTKGNLAANNPDGNSDIWLAKRSGNGSLFFIRQFAVENKDATEAIALDNQGNALLAGNSVFFKNTNFGYEDAFVMKYSLSSPTFLTPFITRPNPTSVRGGTQFTIEGGNFFGIQTIYFDGQPINFTVVSSTRITATAPMVSSSKTGTLTVSRDCFQHNSPIQLTVTP